MRIQFCVTFFSFLSDFNNRIFFDNSWFLTFWTSIYPQVKSKTFVFYCDKVLWLVKRLQWATKLKPNVLDLSFNLFFCQVIVIYALKSEKYCNRENGPCSHFFCFLDWITSTFYPRSFFKVLCVVWYTANTYIQFLIVSTFHCNLAVWFTFFTIFSRMQRLH